jgi:hypothetical protein
VNALVSTAGRQTELCRSLTKTALLFALLLIGDAAEWDRYHARQDGCLKAERIARQCARGAEFCDVPALREAQRDCSAFRDEEPD